MSSDEERQAAPASTWPRSIRLLHWAIALLVVILLVVGVTMVNLPADAEARRLLGRAHTIVGGLTVLLTLIRVFVRARGPAPAPLELGGRLHRLGAEAVHVLTYVAIFGLGASGVAMAATSDWPRYLHREVALAPSLDDLPAHAAHGAFAAFLVALVAAHVAGVVIRQVQRGDALGRMTGR